MMKCKRFEIEVENAEKIVLPAYIPTIEEIFKASGAHRQGNMV